jgi:hypothetical protein
MVIDQSRAPAEGFRSGLSMLPICLEENRFSRCSFYFEQLD